MAVSQTPLGERVPSAVNDVPWDLVGVKQSQTPLGERVPSAVLLGKGEPLLQ